MSETFKPTASMASNAKRALEMRNKQPESNKGMTSVGLARANQLIKREPLSLETVKRMYSFFSRHEVDKRSKEWKAGNSKGEQGWLGWGGDAGYSWSRSIVERAEKKTKDAKETPRQEAKFAYVMKEFEELRLKSSSGALVTSRKQAEAIAASESGMSK